MNEHDVIKFMGRFPDAINPRPLMSNVWKCSKCSKLVENSNEIENPAPCKECGSICFEVVRKQG